MTGIRSRRFTTLVSLALYLGVWKGISLLIGREIILPPPEQVLKLTLDLLISGEAFRQIIPTVLRGLGGFSLSLILGTATGLAAGRSSRFRWFINPLVISIRSVPVLSLILLAIIWFRTELVPVFICFLVVFPIISGSVTAGVRQVDPELLEMARIYRKSRTEVLRHIYLPSILPFLSSGISTGLGLTWKSVVAAEVLSMPLRGMGTAMQTAQLQLDTAVLFGWTVLVVFLAGLFDGLIQLTEIRSRRRGRRGEVRT